MIQFVKEKQSKHLILSPYLPVFKIISWLPSILQSDQQDVLFGVPFWTYGIQNKT